MSGRRFALFFAAVWIFCLLPLAAGRILPFGDYPNHLARFHILAHPNDPFLAAFWQPAWAPLPNLGADLLVVGLARLVPTVLAGKIGVGLMIGLWGFGFAWLHREWRGEWHAWGLLGLPLAYAFPLHMGLLNFVLGIGLMLVGLALHLRLRERSLAIYLAAMAPITFAAAVCHLMAAALLLLIALLLEAALGVTRERRPLSLPAAIARVVPLGLAPLLYVALGPAAGEAGVLAPSSPIQKVRAIAIALFPGAPILDVTFALLLIVGIGLALRTGWRPARTGLVLVVALFVIFLLSPDGLKSTHHLDTRQPILIGLIALAFSAGTIRPLALILLSAALALHVGTEAQLVASRSRGLDRISAALAPLPEGTMVAFAQGDHGGNWAMRNWNPPLLQTPALGVLDHRLYPTSLFAIAGQQPLVVRSEAAAAALVPEHDEPGFPARSIAELRAARARAAEPWRSRAMAVLFASGPEGAKPGPGARLLAAEGRWGLYLLDDGPPAR